MRRTGATALGLGIFLLAIAQPAISAKGGGAAGRIEALVTLKHPKGLGAFVRRVSDPRSAHYRDYASVEELVRRFGAPRKARESSIRWFERHSAHASAGASGTYLLVDAPASWRRLAVAAGDGSGTVVPVPAGLRQEATSIQLLSPRSLFNEGAKKPEPSEPFPPGTGSALPRTGTPAGCAEGTGTGLSILPPGYDSFTPNQYLDAYGHTALHRRGLRGQGMRVSVVEIDGFSRSDIETFGRCFGIRIPPTPVHPVRIGGPLPPGDETTLDLEVLSATAPRLKSIDVYEGTAAEKGVLATLAAALGRRGRHPNAISISLGSCEPELQGQAAALRAMDEVLAVAAGAGISTFVAAGDQGSTACPIPHSALPIPAVSSPASSNFVTAVGGTNIALTPSNSLANQLTWNDVPIFLGGGGGGVSLLNKEPWWQHGRKFNQASATRILPDIAALADPIPGYAIYCSSSECGSSQAPPGWIPIGGTSAATPLMAGGTVLIDQLLRRSGQGPLGLANPLIYDIGRGRKPGKALFDVVIGNNDVGLLTPADAGGGQSIGCCPALPRYDHATGWGSPKLQALAKRALAAGR